jgi:uncharacterized protein (DUF2249 family)
MTITPATRISALLKQFPQTMEAIIAISPAFEKLRNPFLRKLLAGRVSISDAAKMGKCSIADFHRVLSSYGVPVSGFTDVQEPVKQESYFEEEEKRGAKQLDVRPILAGGKDPLEEILKTLRTLPADEVMCLVNTFEPVPLLKKLSGLGYMFEVETEKEIVYTWIKAKAGSTLPEPDESKVAQSSFEAHVNYFAGATRFIDVREMEMPRPLITILQELEHLPQDQALLVEHKKKPVFLMPELQEKGFTCDIYEKAPGQVLLLIYRMSTLEGRED